MITRMRTYLRSSALIRLTALLILACGGGGLVHAADESDKPILRIETGTHTTLVLGLAISPDGARLATASYDTTVRLWSLPKLDLLRTIHLPIGETIEGAVYSVDFSPDGKTLVTSGWTGAWGRDNGPWCFYVIDAVAAEIRRTVCDLPQRTNQIGFSPDGQYLVAVLKAGAGMRVYRTADYRLFREDRDYKDSAIAFDFDKAGRLATSSLDGHLRLYDQAFHLLKSQSMPEGRKPHGVGFSPDGSKIAVGYAEPEGDDPLWPPAVDVVSAQDLSVMFRPDVRGIANGALWRVAWSADGAFLYAGGTWAKGERFPLRRWADGGKGRPSDIAVAANRIVRVKSAPQGVIFSTEIGAFGMLGPDNTAIAERPTAIADYTEIGDVLAVSPDGLSIQFAFEPSGRRVAHFSLATRQLERGESPTAAAMAHQVTDMPNLDVRDWTWSYRPTLNGRPLKMRLHDQALSLTFMPDGKGLLLGTSWQLIRYDANGDVIWARDVFGNARGVVVTPDGRIAVAAIGDGTIRWYAMDTGTELLAFFPHADGERWIAWTPSGYFMSSVGGDSLIGWQVNRGRENTADFFSVGRFSDKYYRPDIVLKTLAALDESKAIQNAEAETGRSVPARGIAELLPPVIDILDPQDGEVIEKAEIDVRYRVRSPSGEPLEQILVRSDDHPLGTFDPPHLDAKGEARGVLHMIVPQRDSRLLVFARNRFTTSEPAVIRLKWGGDRLDVATFKRKLYVLAIGVSDYSDPRLKLGYAAKDAHDFVAALERQKGTAYTEVVPKILTDADASLAGVRDGIAWLDANATMDDIGMIFLAGHGFDAHDGIYYYLPRDAVVDRLAETALPYSDLLKGLKGIAGSAVLFIDTCHAGDVVGRPGIASMDVIGLVSRLSQPSNGVIVYASSTGNQLSLESKVWGNGAFTKAVVEGLDGAAEYGKRDYITTTMLEAYVKERVKDLTASRQTPTVNMPLAVPDLMLAHVSK